MKTLKVGIMRYEEMKKRNIAIARGEYTPKRGEPKVFFPSFEALAGVLSENNRELLQLIVDNQPESMSDLAKISGRKTASLSRTLKSMAGYGLISLEKKPGGKLRPHVQYSDVVLDLPLARKQEHSAA
jgi:predicted transcriptional regulator